MKVLVLEHDAVTRHWLEAGIRTRGHSVTLCPDAATAAEAYRAEPHPIAIVDWAAPRAQRLCRDIRSRRQGPQTVILASGLSDRLVELEDALRAGADDCLPAPADDGVLHARLAVAEARLRRAPDGKGPEETGGEERYVLAHPALRDGFWDWDLAADEMHLSCRSLAMLGYGTLELGTSAAEWVGRIHPDDVERVKVKVAAHLAGRSSHFEDAHRVRGADGEYRSLLVRGFAVRDADGRAHRLTGVQTDVTDLLTCDSLTRLPNRTLFMEQLHQAFARASRIPGSVLGVVVADIDGFRGLNETRGYLAGDQVLMEAARRLESVRRPGDVLGRLGADEFALLVEPIAGRAAVRVAELVRRELARSFVIDGREVLVSASVGIALSSNECPRALDLLREAEAALGKAKARGRGNCEMFDGRPPAPSQPADLAASSR